MVSTSVEKLETAEHVSDQDFTLQIQEGERAMLEDVGIGLRVEKDFALDFAGMRRIEERVLAKMTFMERRQQESSRLIELHRTNYSRLILANLVLVGAIVAVVYIRQYLRKVRSLTGSREAGA